MGLPAVIPQSVLFGNPDKAEPKLSPDGTQYAYLANSEKGVLNVFVQKVGEDKATQVTNDTHRGIRMFEWAKNNKSVLYLQDADGDENWHVYAADLKTGVVRDMTPFQGIRADDLHTDQAFPDEAIVGLNIRDRAAFDLYRLDLLTGALVMYTENPGNVNQWICDAGFKIRGAVANDQNDGSKILKVRDSDTSEWRAIASWPNDETAQFHRFTQDGTGIYVATSMAHGKGDAKDTTRLVVLSAEDGSEKEEVFYDSRCDIDEVIFNDADHAVEAIVVDYSQQEWVVQHSRVQADIDALKAVCTGTLRITSRSTDDTAWIVADMRDDGSPRYFLYKRADRSCTLLFLARPELENYTLVKMTSHVITTSDGEKMVALRTLPAGVEATKLPMVLLVHGGPWARDRWGWNAQAQWLSNRGYACLMVNFRASTGYGKRWLHLGDAQWGATMQQDLTDAVGWAVKEGFADEARVAIMGGSYGGYATLAGLAYTPDLYCCGVDIVGPAHLRTLLQSIPPYWAPMKKMLTLRVGDVEKDDALNKKCSPFYHAEQIKKPLLIAQGANDPRVKKAESDQMVSAMHKVGTAVEYILYTDEGHGFARPQNRVDFYLRTEKFLERYCGGRCGADEPEQTKGNSAEKLDPASIIL